MSHSRVANVPFLQKAFLVTLAVSSEGTTKGRGRMLKVTGAPGVRKKCRNVKTISVVRFTHSTLLFSANKQQASLSRFSVCLFFLVDETEDGDEDTGDSSEGWTDIYPSAPYEETSQPADVTNEQRGDVPPPATTESLVQPVATTDPTTTTTTASAASTVRGPQVTVPPATSEPATWTPQIHSTVKQEEATKNMEEQEEKVKRTTRPVGQEVKTEQGLDKHPSVQQSCGSTLVPSLLFACVSGIFSLRL